MAYKTITIMGDGVRKERTANAAITPGQLIYILSTDKVAVHADAGGVAQRMFAVEDDLQGKEIGDAYSANNVCVYCVFRPGDEVYALIADGENIAIGDKLVSNGDGDLKEATLDSSGEDHVLAIALEAIDLSDSSGADPASRRCRVEIM